MASYSCSTKYTRLASIRYQHLSLENLSNTVHGQPCEHIIYLNIMFSQENCVSHTSDMCELQGLAGCVVEPLVYTRCSGRFSPKVM